MKKLLFILTVLICSCSEDSVNNVTPPPPPNPQPDTITMLLYDSVWSGYGHPADSLVHNWVQNVDTLRIEFTLSCVDVKQYTCRFITDNWQIEKKGFNYDPPISFDSIFSFKAVINDSLFETKFYISPAGAGSILPTTRAVIRNIKLWHIRWN